MSVRWRSTMRLLSLACPLRSGLYVTNEHSGGGMNNTPAIETGLGTLIITGSSGRIGSAFLDRIGESYAGMGFDRKTIVRRKMKN